jgi:hypothetical protein
LLEAVQDLAEAPVNGSATHSLEALHQRETRVGVRLQ